MRSAVIEVPSVLLPVFTPRVPLTQNTSQLVLANDSFVTQYANTTGPSAANAARVLASWRKGTWLLDFDMVTWSDFTLTTDNYAFQLFGIPPTNTYDVLRAQPQANAEVWRYRSLTATFAEDGWFAQLYQPATGPAQNLRYLATLIGQRLV